MTDANRSRRSEWVYVLALLLVCSFVWVASYHRWTAQAWATPITYASDALWGMASAKAVAAGEIFPFLPKHPVSLGAPFVANWNDYPSVEEGVLSWSGLLARLFGVFGGANLSVFAAHLFAALAFYFVCRHLRYDAMFAVAGSLVFSFSRYAFSRGLLHAGLTYYWHIPLGLLAVWWCTRERSLLDDRRRLAAGLAIAVLHGIQNPYYTWMFAQLLGLAAAYQLLRRAKLQTVLAPLLLLATAGFTFALMNADTFYSRLVLGPTGEVVARNYQGLEFYALKPIELILPVVHRVDWLHNWARETYFAKTMLIGEAGSPYLGVIGVLALLWLVWVSAAAITRSNARSIPPHAWVLLWILVYAVVGGINGIVGLFFQLFRGSNRYSIFILAVVLLFLVRQLTKTARSWHVAGRLALAGGIVAVALLDQIPPGLTAAIPTLHAQVEADREIVERLEAQLPRRAMIFQLPVASFPEAGRVGGMNDYEHFRPYLHARFLRFSYGSVRGRTREAWQKEVEMLGVARGMKMLERYGFATVWINRSGYPDGGAAVVDQLRSNGRGQVLAENHEFICIALQPSAKPELPPEFVSGLYDLETGGDDEWRWSSGDAVVILHNDTAADQTVRVAFEIGTIRPRAIEITVNGQVLLRSTVENDQERAVFNKRVLLRPGSNVIRLETDVPGELPGNGDPRKLAFRLWNFRVLD